MFFDDKRVRQDQAHRTDTDRNAILAQSKAEREKRKLQKDQQIGAVVVQKFMRGFLASKMTMSQLQYEQVPKIVGEVALLCV